MDVDVPVERRPIKLTVKLFKEGLDFMTASIRTDDYKRLSFLKCYSRLKFNAFEIEEMSAYRNNLYLSDDFKTLKDYGISDGDTICLYETIDGGNEIEAEATNLSSYTPPSSPPSSPVAEVGIDKTLEKAQCACTDSSLRGIRMTFVTCEIGPHLVDAALDIASEMTVMSIQCVEKLGYLERVDPKYKCSNKGPVGIRRFVGRITNQEFYIGDDIFRTNIYIAFGIEVEMSLGLDILKASRIDLYENLLTFPVLGSAVPIYSLPDVFRLHFDKTPDWTQLKKRTINLEFRN